MVVEAAAEAAVAAAAAGVEKGVTMRFTAHGFRASAVALVAALTLVGLPAAHAQQKTFVAPEQAMDAFGDAVARSDQDAMKDLLGADYRALIPPVGAEIRYRFLEAWAKSHAIKLEGDDRALVAVGDDGWTLPIPIVKGVRGWRFDTRAGADEIRVRRIGRNERAVMQVMLAIYDAQREYAVNDRNGNGLREYAAKFQSAPGRRDGLYWPSKAGEAESPLGPAVAAARAAGGGANGYYGYRYRILTGQGKSAPGGAYSYLVRGRMLGGFAVLAWPARYGETGVMTFMVSHDGVLYEKDLGPGTASRASAIQRFDPDASWQKVQPDI